MGHFPLSFIFVMELLHLACKKSDVYVTNMKLFPGMES